MLLLLLLQVFILHLYFHATSCRKMKKLISFLVNTLWAKVKVVQFIFHEVSHLFSLFHPCLFRGPGLQHLVPKDAEVALFLVFTVPYYWNVTFGTLAVIRHMLMVVLTYNDIDNAVIMREKDKTGSWEGKTWNSTEWEASQDANIESLWCSPFITSFLEVKTHQLFSSCQRKKQELRQSLFLTLARIECKHRNKTTWFYIYTYIYVSYIIDLLCFF